MNRDPSQQWQSLGAFKVAVIIGLGCLVCSAARANDLFGALETSDIAQIRTSLDAGADVNVKNESGETPLWVAAQNGHTEIVRLLLAAKADVNATNKTPGATPLWVAAQNGHTEIVQLLLAAGADVNAADEERGATPLLKATYQGNTEIVRLLLAANADVDAYDKNPGVTPLLWAAESGHTEIVRLLLAANADVNAGRKKDGVPPLLMAAQNGHTEIVELLLAAGADVDVSVHVGLKDHTALSVATERRHSEIVTILKDHGASETKRP